MGDFTFTGGYSPAIGARMREQALENAKGYKQLSLKEAGAYDWDRPWNKERREKARKEVQG